MRYYLYPPKWLKLKRTIISITEKGANECSDSDGGTISWYGHINYIIYSCGPCNDTPSYMFERTWLHTCIGDICKNAHSSTAENNKKLEGTQMPIGSRMDKIMACSHWEEL